MNKIRKEWVAAAVAVFVAVNALAGGAWICASLGNEWELWGLMGLGMVAGICGVVAAGTVDLAIWRQRKEDEARARARRRAVIHSDFPMQRGWGDPNREK
jgi:hypothetical protein